MNSTGFEDILCEPQTPTSRLDVLIGVLQDRLQRLPTERELHTFINGTRTQRQHIWNSR